MLFWIWGMSTGCHSDEPNKTHTAPKTSFFSSPSSLPCRESGKARKDAPCHMLLHRAITVLRVARMPKLRLGVSTSEIEELFRVVKQLWTRPSEKWLVIDHIESTWSCPRSRQLIDVDKIALFVTLPPKIIMSHRQILGAPTMLLIAHRSSGWFIFLSHMKMRSR